MGRRQRAGLFGFAWTYGKFFSFDFASAPKRRRRRRRKRDSWNMIFTPPKRGRGRGRRRAEKKLRIEGQVAKSRALRETLSQEWAQKTDWEKKEASIYDRVTYLRERFRDDVWVVSSREVNGLIRVAQDYGWSDRLPSAPAAEDQSTRLALRELIRGDSGFYQDVVDVRLGRARARFDAAEARQPSASAGGVFGWFRRLFR